MKVFSEYAEYYDLFYKDKNYKAETSYVLSIIQRFAPGAKHLLEFGCGTGNYSRCLVDQGYYLIGIDLSPAMVRQAESRLKTSGGGHPAVVFYTGDIRTYRDGQKYDAILSLFHVISYQTTNEDLEATFRTARNHLEVGGLFVFDCWYGPGVLSDPPKNPIKTVADTNLKATRRTTSILMPNRNLVRVHFDVLLEDTDSGVITELSEDHDMRYLFTPEILELAALTGFETCAAYRWLTEQDPDSDTWYACFVLRAN